MNDDKHVPTDEFVEYLARDTMRRLRYESRFAPAPRVHQSRLRFTNLAIAAGVVFTLSTGMVLGASANYASAEVLPNGTTMIPSRPALAILPIKNALSAIGCTQPAERANTATVTMASTSTSSAASSSSTAATRNVEATAVDQVATPAVNQNPDRAMIALLARQHQPAVVRGDTTSDFIVMVLDATQNYLWSTHGNGNVSVEVGGDSRTSAERAEYNRVYGAELRGRGMPAVLADYSAADSSRKMRIVFSKDTMSSDLYRYYASRTSPDSSGVFRVQFRDTTVLLKMRGGDGMAGGAGAGSASGGGGGLIRTSGAMSDTLHSRVKYGSPEMDTLSKSPVAAMLTARAQSDMACGRFAPRVKRANGVAMDTASNANVAAYTTGFLEPRFGMRCNQAAGLQERGAGESGIVGLASVNVAKTDMYLFTTGELAPRDLKVMVVHLTAGTYWSGR